MLEEWWDSVDGAGSAVDIEKIIEAGDDGAGGAVVIR